MNFSLKEIFKGCCLLFSYQGSFLLFFSSDSFYILSKAFSLCQELFLFFCFVRFGIFMSDSSDSLYRLSHPNFSVNHFLTILISYYQLLLWIILLNYLSIRDCPFPRLPLYQKLLYDFQCRSQRRRLSYHANIQLSIFFIFFIFFR